MVLQCIFSYNCLHLSYSLALFCMVLMSHLVFPFLMSFWSPLYVFPLLHYAFFLLFHLNFVCFFIARAFILCAFPLSSFFFHVLYLFSYYYQACEIPESTVFTFPPSDESSPAKPCSVPYWDLLQAGVQEKVEFPLPLKHMLLSLRPDAGVGSAAWSLPTPVRPDFPRQSVSIPMDQDSGGGLSSRWVRQSIYGFLAVTVHLKGIKHQLALVIKQGFTLLNPADEAEKWSQHFHRQSPSFSYVVI